MRNVCANLGISGIAAFIGSTLTLQVGTTRDLGAFHFCAVFRHALKAILRLYDLDMMIYRRKFK